ncbi:archease [Methanococcus maripaludis]|jgi:SHS2 domain-containing protein|uniref:Protein archease n=3 Tax=Methanococcus maripaludis TaxID=39152 RepID=A0A7J9S053_METMI|nr:archease [Methanococcus maripaludis]MDK2929479.1 protein archease [Methanococcus sp.]MBB6067745.1 SHS2 domain-containing protein [Methanococcus maripaludis]MBG0769874.1 archease [Methanococcus maripaludis]MBM7408633.1 SHS2 domain-containing protein [Methanococcus maripaludis]MBP2219848.1 SHS2 domain-containing protein [Methanococcus maripaludis]
MYNYFETTADIGIIAFGKTLEESFENSARGLSNIMVDIESIEKIEKHSFKVISEDLFGLLYDFLTELLILHDSELLIFSEFNVKIERNECYELSCVAFGDRYSKDKYEPKEEVKAITYHRMEIIKNENCWKTQFIVDL